jgi:Fe-S-cluster-containing dehydrogenase component
MRPKLPIHRDAPGDSGPMTDQPPAAVSRRDVLAALATMTAFAALPSCRRPEQKIVPYVRQPEDVVPGNPLHFATALSMMGTAFGVIVESHEGRPTKIKGNPLHPETQGATSSFLQASILDLYDPDRSRGPRKRNLTQTWDSAESMLSDLGQTLEKTRGRSLAIITDCHRSPTLLSATRDLQKAMPEAQIVRYEPFDGGSSAAGLNLAFGRPLEAAYQLSESEVILALDSDFLGLEGSPIRAARDWSQRRAPERGPMSRLYVFESSMTVTGSNADHRFRCASGETLEALCALATELQARELELGDALTREVVRISAVTRNGPWSKRAAIIATDLLSRPGRSLIIPGCRQPAVVHALAHALNHALGNVGISVKYVKPFDDSVAGTQALKNLTRSIMTGATDTVLMLGVNPAYDAPGDIAFADALRRVPLSIHVGTHVDETAAASTWHLNRAHPLESWGDAISLDGTASLVQPLIAPLWGGRTDAEILRALAGQQGSDFNWVQDTWMKQWGRANFERNWRCALRDGIVQGSAYSPEEVHPDFDQIATALAGVPPRTAALYEGVFAPDAHSYDGRFANNPWMQEQPDSITKLTWGNAARISAAIAQSMGLSDGDVVSLSAPNHQIQLPVVIVPGQSESTITMTIGQGKKQGGSVARGVGVNTNSLRSSASPYRTEFTSLEKTAARVHLARTQEHFNMEGRPLALEGLVSAPAATRSDHGGSSPIPQRQTRSLAPRAKAKSNPRRSWGMSIDLSKCTGCNACMIACQAENNVSVVGIDGIRRDREMHWLRIDRYFTGPSEEPTTVAQPIVCQQCENAPCESVCPVGATAHSPEGLNDMVYNRCVGSRYCANNCPFKVRRFNFFEYWGNVSAPRQMQLNPDVTVRSRGVMEKCTFCVQRINSAKIDQKKCNSSRIADGTIVTACEQACPTAAITFGDLSDPASRVTEIVSQQRSYRLLDELNLEPHVYYLSKIRNPNPDLAT